MSESLHNQLIEAVTYHRVDEVKRLLEAGADPNYDSYIGKSARERKHQPYTPLRLVMFCISDSLLEDDGLRDFAAVARLLIERGADPEPAMQLAEERYGKYSAHKKGDLFMDVWDVVANANNL